MRNRTLLVKLARMMVCVLVFMMLVATGCGKKVNKKTPTDSKQEVSKEDDDTDLPILSNEGEELVIDEEDEKTPADSDKNDNSSVTDSKKTEKEPVNDLNNTLEKEPAQDANDGEEKEPEQDSDDEKEEDNKPVELPFVPADKMKK